MVVTEFLNKLILGKGEFPNIEIKKIPFYRFLVVTTGTLLGICTLASRFWDFNFFAFYILFFALDLSNSSQKPLRYIISDMFSSHMIKSDFRHGRVFNCFKLNPVTNSKIFLRVFPFILLIFIFLGTTLIGFGQTTIWEEDFTYSDGTTSATKDGISWSTSGVSSGDGVAIYNNVLRGRRTNQGGRDTWTTDTSIDISGYLNVTISVEVSSSGSMEINNDYVQVQYSFDGLNWNIFDNNGYQRGNISGTVIVSQNGLQDTSLLIKIVMRNNSSFEYYYVDNILVTGLLSVAPTCTNFDYPLNGAGSVALNTNLVWHSDLYATGYYLYFGTDNPPTNIINGSDYTSVFYNPPTDLNTNTTYYWQIVPHNASGSASGCAIWSFTTGTTAIVDTTIKQLFNNGQDLTFNFPFTGCAIISDALLTVTVHGDINGNASNEYYLINHESGLVGQVGPTYSGSNDCDLETVQYTIDISDMQNFSSDNTITLVADPQNGVDELCSAEDLSYVEMNLQYSYATIPTCEITAPETVCSYEQNISVLAPDEMDSYFWSITSGDAIIDGSNSSQEVLVNAGNSDFTIELILESYPGCEETCSVDISVNPLPTATISSNNSPICEKDNAEFIITGTSGAIVTYNINGNTDTITLAGGIATITVFVDIGDGDQTLNLESVIDSNCSQLLSESSTITVNPLPIIGSFN